MAKRGKSAAQRTGSPVALEAHLRSGAGKHDNRPSRQRTRGDAKRAAIREFS